ncbi:heparan-alpha-glucosaminide N-acetyltransferase domain-containing protein [Sphingomonas sp. LR61]|uniref:heparan-alpha-glucosaminide N-acetyltransferase domain-containing protein n=1 Tax=Sphingomonas sp. LR61 TaxID=3050234 RepID=UPI002FE0F3E6
MTDTRPVPPTAVRGASVSGVRLQGVDVARAVALLGMMAAHIGGIADQLDWSDPSTWSAVAHGRPSTLFAVLAGVSIGLTSGRTTPPGPPTIGRVRARLAIRAAAVVAIGFVLIALDTPVYVILPTYGVLFLLVIPVLRVRPAWLLAIAGACAVLSPIVAVATAPAYADAGMVGQQLGLVYPVVTFLAYVLVGLAVARAGLEMRGTQVVLLASGTLVAATAYVVGTVLAPLPSGAAFAFPGSRTPPRAARRPRPSPSSSCHRATTRRRRWTWSAPRGWRWRSSRSAPWCSTGAGGSPSGSRSRSPPSGRCP